MEGDKNMTLFQLDRDVKVVLPDGSTRSLTDYLLPSALLMAAAFILIISMFLPYWKMTLYAPQYPQGLKVHVYVNELRGDVEEIDELNHYLGMPKLDSGGKLERNLSRFLLIALAMLLIAGVFVHNQWAGIFALPAIGFPLVMLADLKYILYKFGHSIDPTSALGSAVKPFTPPLFGKGKIGQFETISFPEAGLYLASISVIVLIVALYLHRRAYKPVVDARKHAAGNETVPLKLVNH